MAKEYWVCVVGPVERDNLPEMGADGPPRYAVEESVEQMLAEHGALDSNDFRISSGWGVSSETAERVEKIVASGHVGLSEEVLASI